MTIHHGHQDIDESWVEEEFEGPVGPGEREVGVHPDARRNIEAYFERKRLKELLGDVYDLDDIDLD